MIRMVKRGRPKGSRDRLQGVVHGVRVGGSSTSAAAMNCRAGRAEVSSLWVYVRGEGFVRWAEIEEEVNEAYRQWRRKKAEQGVYIYDFEEERQNEILGGRAPGDTRRSWLMEWRGRHKLIVAQAA